MKGIIHNSDLVWEQFKSCAPAQAWPHDIVRARTISKIQRLCAMMAVGLPGATTAQAPVFALCDGDPAAYRNGTPRVKRFSYNEIVGKDHRK
jgi:hypothetical protein